MIGYGLEDDENKPGLKAFSFTVGDNNVIAALNDALPGMKVGETRRLSVLVSICVMSHFSSLFFQRNMFITNIPFNLIY